MGREPEGPKREEPAAAGRASGAAGDDEPAFAGWDAETTAMLRALFAEEAQEHLEVMHRAVMLLDADPQSLQELLRRAHTLKGAAATVGFAAVGRAAHMLEERCVGLQGPGAPALTREVGDELIGALDTLERMLAGEGDERALLDELAALLGTRGARRLPEAERVARAPAGETAEARDRRRIQDRRMGERRTGDGGQLMRVDAGQVEELMNSVGQLVIDRTRVERQVEHLKGLTRDLSVSHQALRAAVHEVGKPGMSSALRRVEEVEVEIADSLSGLQRAATAFTEESDALGRTTRALKEHLAAVGMMPMRWIYARLQRPAREQARAEGKSVQLETEGEATELDRSVAEKISDPLIHLVRNAIAHGIEGPGLRRSLGKPEQGRIVVSARHRDNMLVVSVEDDGAGIDPAGLQRAARRLGMPAEEIPSSEAELIDLIFSSGFSTRAEVDGFAGRGLGLDVVRGNVAELGGELRVVSRPGTGTRFSMRVPMTTTITQALLFKEGDHVFAIPVTHVSGTHAVPESAAEQHASGQRVRVRERWLPLLRLDALFGWMAAAQPVRGGLSLIELRAGGHTFAVTCRKIVGPREIVVKQLGPLLGALPFFSGATISGSGKVQLVLDVLALGELARRGAIALPPGHLSWTRRPRGIVLVADDSLSTREALAVMLRAEGLSVDAAADGWEAWERLQTRRYDLLITDLEMPRVHGTDLIARCRRSVELARLPIVVLTSRTAEQNLAAARKAGADECLKKPLNRRMILERVKALLPPRQP